MKFTCKHINYNAPGGELYINPWVETGEIKIDAKNKKLVVPFLLYTPTPGDGVRILDRYDVVLVADAIETTIEVDGVVTEVVEYVTGGGEYSADLINNWGRPSFDGSQSYFNVASIWSGLEFADQPLKQLAIDWVLNVVKLHNLPLKEFFELQTE